MAEGRAALLLGALLLSLALLHPAPQAAAWEGAFFGYCTDAIRTGWNFYCDPPPPEEEPEEAPAPQAAPEAPSAAPPEPTAPSAKSYAKQIEDFRREMDELKYRAVLEPTPEHVEAYMEAQQRMSRMAAAFTDQWQRVLFRTPSLDINTRFPMSQMGGAVYQDQVRVARETSLREAAANLGFMVVVEDPARCGLCTPQLEIVARMRESFGIEVIVVSADGSFHPLFSEAAVDTGQLRAFGLADSPKPTIALVEPRNGVVEPIGSGLLTEDVILERVHVVTSVPAGERY